MRNLKAIPNSNRFFASTIILAKQVMLWEERKNRLISLQKYYYYQIQNGRLYSGRDSTSANVHC